MNTPALIDAAVYGAAVVAGLWVVIGRYYGRKKPPKPDEGTKPKDE